jgi:hypothetical protein
MATTGSSTRVWADSRSLNQSESMSVRSQRSTMRQKSSAATGADGHGPGITPMRYLIRMPGS